MSAASGPVLAPATVAHRRGLLGAVVGTAVLAVSVIGLAASDRWISLASGLPGWLMLAGFVGIVTMVVASWIVRAERPAVVTGLSVMVVGLAVPSWTAWDWLPVDALPFLLAAAPIAVAGAAHISLGWLSPLRRPRTLVATYVLAGLGVVLIAVGYDPLADPGCAFTCADAQPVASGLLTTRGAVIATAVFQLAAAAPVGWALAAERRTPRVLRLSAGVGLTLLAATWAVRAMSWSEPVPIAARVGVEIVAVTLVAAAVLASAWVVRRSRLAAERLIADLDDATSTSSSIGGVRAVEFKVPGEERWVDPDGRSAPSPSSDGAVVVLHNDREPVIRFWLAAGASPPALDTIGPSARVGLANARLAAVTRARLEDVQASRRRIVLTSDAERRRIEKDLHDGAQQRLITASLHVSLAANRLPQASVAKAQRAIGAALEQLRRIAHGLGTDAK